MTGQRGGRRQLPHLLTLAFSRTARAEHAEQVAAADPAIAEHTSWLGDLRTGDTDADRLAIARRQIALILEGDE
ncbi:hypothetical protein FLW53_23295 [Microbispora sp. SCL1-1]|uniref:hypothetical protein n=1 Tax=unclassified Microbispora TaxID=2614687 RepID=UPI001158B994|nr:MULTISPECIES: hypothetical protein [unclassified Microbispora]NJP27069.1 hypothetical protein [Microbispora sp. CL1-1]TQS11417.1 hypothetical protein FLW53_23295 [Microbispora sp. SCL1-1]